MCWDGVLFVNIVGSVVHQLDGEGWCVTTLVGWGVLCDNLMSIMYDNLTGEFCVTIE